jgi:cobalt-zinc-cadmium efflux system membrane fusion protein
MINSMNKRISTTILSALFYSLAAISNNTLAANTAQETHQEGVSFTPEQMTLANIKVSTLLPKIFAKTIYAPGEIKANGYTS